MRKEFKIGLAGIAALLILFFGINYLKGINMFKPESYYYVEFEDINGLAKSSPVFANGYKVGIVNDIQYTTTIRDMWSYAWKQTMKCAFPAEAMPNW